MFNRILKMFGQRRKILDVEWEELNEAKEKALSDVLGTPYESVLHALIPYYLGGALDLYPFPEPGGGTLYVTQEVIAPDPRNGPKPSALGRYELAAYTRKPFQPSEDRVLNKDNDPHETGLISRMLNPIARYSSMAVLNPGETMEIPGEQEDGSDALHVLLDKLDTGGREFRILGEKCGLLLCIAIHRTECNFAKANGSDVLLKRLKGAGIYPYSHLDRAPVV
jgi:hypothetical protein